MKDAALRSRETADKLASKIGEAARRLGKPAVRLMHVCGTHEDTVSRYGIRDLLPEGMEIIPGPGCPVCVTTSREIDEALALCGRAVVTTFGDLMKVPGSDGRSLADARAEGGDVRVVYSIYDALAMAAVTDRDVVHVAVGFETTAPSTASVLLEGAPGNFSILCCHRLVPPAMEALLSDDDVRIDGFINPGHVSAIIGEAPYARLGERYGVPQVIAGFEPADLLLSVLMLLEMMERGEGSVRNEYVRVVRPGGNERALAMLDEAFETCDVAWRGFPPIPGSGLRPRERFSGCDARLRYGLALEDRPESAKGCICGDVLKGKAYPDACRLFGKACTPEHPVGACMVSSEGSCGIWFRYGRF
jgi:hydrogenase expression/formation protein HypD